MSDPARKEVEDMIRQFDHIGKQYHMDKGALSYQIKDGLRIMKRIGELVSYDIYWPQPDTIYMSYETRYSSQNYFRYSLMWVFDHLTQATLESKKRVKVDTVVDDYDRAMKGI